MPLLIIKYPPPYTNSIVIGHIVWEVIVPSTSMDGCSIHTV